MTKLIFFGNERLSSGYHTEAPTLQALIDAGYDIAAVVTNYEAARSRKPRPLEIAAVAATHDIPVLYPAKPAEIIDQLREYEAEAGILVAYGCIVPQSVIDLFPRGIINIHPSLLPLHRGPIPIEAVMLSGATETGVSLMQLVRAMDAGPVYRQVRLALQGNETKQTLTTSLLELGKDALLDCLPSKSAEQICREIRAYAVWPKSRMVIASKDVTITTAHPARSESTNGERPAIGTLFVQQDRSLAVQTSDGILIIESLIPAGKSEMSAKAFLAGNPLAS
jgi:methionyl-tRNA formyltransferase